MKVWILEIGSYEEREVTGVYRTAELAMQLNGPEEGCDEGPKSSERPGGWRYVEAYNEWHNGLEWEDAAWLREMEVIESVEQAAGGAGRGMSWQEIAERTSALEHEMAKQVVHMERIEHALDAHVMRGCGLGEQQKAVYDAERA